MTNKRKQAIDSLYQKLTKEHDVLNRHDTITDQHTDWYTTHDMIFRVMIDAPDNVKEQLGYFILDGMEEAAHDLWEWMEDLWSSYCINSFIEDCKDARGEYIQWMDAIDQELPLKTK